MLGDKIAELRERSKLTQEELADKIGITRAALSHYEKNRREPDNATIIRLAEFFNVTTDALLGRRENSQELNQKPNKEELIKIFESLPLEEQKAFLKKYINSVLS